MKIAIILLSFVLASCASAPKQKAQPEVKQAPTVTKPTSGAIKIDVDGLKRSLGLDRSRGDLGYQEKRFNTCSAGFGYPKENCSDQFFVSINFRLQCRDTTGTTSEIVTSSQMDPIANKNVRWQIGKAQSVSLTDEEGYAQINGVWTNPPRPQRLRLAVDSHFVYVRAGELTRIVVPSNWCSPN